LPEGITQIHTDGADALRLRLLGNDRVPLTTFCAAMRITPRTAYRLINRGLPAERIPGLRGFYIDIPGAVAFLAAGGARDG
jgi:hypothetical protein